MMLSQYGNYTTAAAAATDALIDITSLHSPSFNNKLNRDLLQCWQHELLASVAGQLEYQAQELSVPFDAIMISPRASS